MPLTVEQGWDDQLGHKAVCEVLMGSCRPARGSWKP